MVHRDGQELIRVNRDCLASSDIARIEIRAGVLASCTQDILTVVELGRRRRWSEEKLRIVLESLEAPRLVSSVARHGITRSLLSDWRRALKVERSLPSPLVPVLVPAVVVSDPPLPAKAAPRRRDPRSAAQGRLVIEMGRGRRVVVDGAVDPDALARVNRADGPPG